MDEKVQSPKRKDKVMQRAWNPVVAGSILPGIHWGWNLNCLFKWSSLISGKRLGVLVLESVGGGRRGWLPTSAGHQGKTNAGEEIEEGE